MDKLVNTIDSLVSAMNEEKQKSSTNFFLEILDIGLGMELEEMINNQIETMFCNALGKHRTMSIDYRSDYRIKIKLSDLYAYQDLDIIPYKLIDGKEVIGCKNDAAILPFSEALQKTYPAQFRCTDKLMTIKLKLKPESYYPWLYPFKSPFTGELLKQVPNTCNYHSNQNTIEYSYHPIIMYVYKKRWAKDLIVEINEVIETVKKIVEDNP